MSNTQKRIASALVLTGLLVYLFILGAKPLLGFILVAGIIAVDELYCNFFRKKRFGFNYFISEALFIAPFVYLNFLEKAPGFFNVFINGALALNAFLLAYLFALKMESSFLIKLTSRIPYFASVIILFPMMALSDFFHYQKWQSVIIVLLLVTFSMDTGAWFFGKNFGKHKLWPKVSPKKTVEGLIGGALTAGVMGLLSWWYLFDKISFILFISFCFLGLISQVGDLIQSKIKRQFEIKDSSNLIPGHGGVYDRIDSLLFLTPFYAVMLKSYYFN